jgi:hypothetical protein
MSKLKRVFHKSFRPEVDVQSLNILRTAVSKWLQEGEGLNVAQIEVVTATTLAAKYPEIQDALDAAVKAVGLPIEDAELVICEWAAVHADYTFAGRTFASLVVSTGRNPYYMQSVLTHKSDLEMDDTWQVDDAKLILKQGDVFVFDPTVPHMAVPTRPADGQLLVLMQWAIPTEDELAMANLLGQFPKQREEENRLDFFQLG